MDTSQTNYGPIADPDYHPATDNTNDLLCHQLTPTEKLCRKIANWTGAPIALVAAIILQVVWIAVGILTHLDPYPFVFLLTCSNVIQLILIFVIAVAQSQSSQHDELRAEADHSAISRLLHHQEAQEELLLKIAAKLNIETSEVNTNIDLLAS